MPEVRDRDDPADPEASPQAGRVDAGGSSEPSRRPGVPEVAVSGVELDGWVEGSELQVHIASFRLTVERTTER